MATARPSPIPSRVPVRKHRLPRAMCPPPSVARRSSPIASRRAPEPRRSRKMPITRFKPERPRADRTRVVRVRAAGVVAVAVAATRRRVAARCVPMTSAAATSAAVTRASNPVRDGWRGLPRSVPGGREVDALLLAGLADTRLTRRRSCHAIREPMKNVVAQVAARIATGTIASRTTRTFRKASRYPVVT